MIEQQLKQAEFDFISEQDKQFIIAFTDEMEKRGYTYDNTIGKGHCWGRYMMIYRKANLKTQKVVARIYIKDQGIVLRLFFNNVTKHGDFIRQAPDAIKTVFMGEQANYAHCSGEDCRFQKKYVIDGVEFVKCNGSTFQFRNPTLEQLPDYIRLFDEFYPTKNNGKEDKP